MMKYLLCCFFFSLLSPADLSKAGMAEFQEKLRLQHETSMHKELEKLLTTVKGAEQEVGLGFRSLEREYLVHVCVSRVVVLEE
jgi:hypothetical protein